MSNDNLDVGDILLISAISVVIFLFLVWLGSSVNNNLIESKCEQEKYFVIDSQKYECRPTGEWIDE